jgi:hypothetical protein
MYMGDYIVIEQKTGRYSFICCCVSTGAGFSATVDPDKQIFFDDHSFPDMHPSACRFLRPLGEGRIGCTIHEESPAPCKYYRCVVMRIYSASGEEAGIITGTLALHSQDPALLSLWNTISREITGATPDNEEKIRQSLEQAGYRVR